MTGQFLINTVGVAAAICSMTSFIPQAVKTRDTALLHRVLIQLRSFDNLLAFRFG